MMRIDPHTLVYSFDETYYFVSMVLMGHIAHRERPYFNVTVIIRVDDDTGLIGDIRNDLTFRNKAKENRKEQLQCDISWQDSSSIKFAYW